MSTEGVKNCSLRTVVEGGLGEEGKTFKNGKSGEGGGRGKWERSLQGVSTATSNGGEARRQARASTLLDDLNGKKKVCAVCGEGSSESDAPYEKGRGEGGDNTKK